MSYATDKLKQYRSPSAPKTTQTPVQTTHPTVSQQVLPERTPITNQNVNPFDAPWWKQLINPQVYKETLKAIPETFNKENRGTLAQAELGAGKQYLNNTLGGLIRAGIWASPFYNPLTKNKLNELNKKSQDLLAPKNESQKIGAPVGRLAGVISSSEAGGAAVSPIIKGLGLGGKAAKILSDVISGTSTGQFDVQPGESRSKRALSDAASIAAFDVAGAGLGALKGKLSSGAGKVAENASYATSVDELGKKAKTVALNFSKKDLAKGKTVYRGTLGTGEIENILNGKAKYSLSAPGDVGMWDTSRKVAERYGREGKSLLFPDANIKGTGNFILQGKQLADGTIIPTKAIDAFNPKKVIDLINPKPGQLAALSSGTGSLTPETADYLKSLKGEQTAAKGVSKGFATKGKSLLEDIKTKLVDSTAPIEDTLFKAQKTGGYRVLPSKDVSLQIDRVLRSKTLASRFANDNGLVDTIRQVPDIEAFNQYLIAKQARDVGKAGFTTGRDAARDAKLIKELDPVYKSYADDVYKYGNTLLNKAVDDGLISKKLASSLVKKYPNYVPLNRVFNELELAVPPQGIAKGGVASLSKQTAIRKLSGSNRAIQNPLESLLLKTDDVFNQGERNQAAKMIGSYANLPGNPFGLRELRAGESAAHTISYLDDGVKKTFETTPEIANAAKSLNRQQLGLLGKILNAPVRIFKLGTTSLNPGFTASNIAKDQATAFINSNYALRTSAANPKVFSKAAYQAIGHGDIYDEWIRNAGGGTSFDIARNAPDVTVESIRSGKSLGTSAKYVVKHPSELLRKAEDIVARSEELTRLQQYIGTKDALIASGRTAKDAELLAAKASRENTVNFSRAGDWGRVLNSVVPYLNAGVQGGRTLVKNLATKPAQTVAKIAITGFMPLATVTAWNLTDPERRKAYEDIQSYEKDGNFVIIPPNPTKDENGKWNVIKIPMSQEIARLTVPLRKTFESLAGYDPASFGDFAKAVIGSTTGLETNNARQAFGQFVPQAIKPGVELTLNKNLFTGADIVPPYVGPKGHSKSSKDLPPSEQVNPDTSGTARLLARALGISPIKAEYLFGAYGGGVGREALNASDQTLALLGAIPRQQIGGRSLSEDIATRFSKASGGSLDAAKSRVEKTGRPETVNGYIVYKEKGIVKVKKISK